MTNDPAQPAPESQEPAGVITAGVAPGSSSLPAEPKAPEGKGSSPTSDAPAWTAQLESNLRGDERITKHKTLSELGKAYIDLQGKLQAAIIPPAEGASDDEVREYRRKLGVPDSPDDYVLDGETVAALGSPELEKNFQTWAHGVGLSKQQAATLARQFADAKNTIVSQAQQRQRSEAESRRTETEQTLKKEWGLSYDDKMTSVRRALNALTPATFQKYLDQTGLGNHPDMIRMFARLGDEMRESPFVSGSSAKPERSAAEVLYRNS